MTARLAALLMAAAAAWPSDAATAGPGCPVRIGGFVPLSAPGTAIGGEAMREAMRIAEDEVNAAGGVLGCRFEVVIGDTEGLPRTGAALVRRLVEEQGAVALAGGYHSAVGLAAKDVAEALGVPIVFAETWHDRITADRQKYVFRIAPLSSWASATIWRHALEIPGVKRVAILTEDTEYGRPAAEETRAGLATGGLDALVYTVEFGATDYSGIVERIAADRPDMLIVLATGEASFAFTRQAADAGIGPMDIPFHANQIALDAESYWAAVPDGTYAFVQRIGIPESALGLRGKAFVAAYTARTGKAAAEPYAMEAYDAVMLLAQAIGEAGSTDGAAIVAALERIEHDGALGTIRFPYGSGRDPAEDGLGDEWWHQWPDVALTVIQYQERGQGVDAAPIVWPEALSTGAAVIVGR